MIFRTKFVADVGTETYYTDDTQEIVLKVNGTVILRETYSPANGQITIGGLRPVLEAAIHGDLHTLNQDAASAMVALSSEGTPLLYEYGQLFASRLRNPRDPSGAKTVMAAGDLVAVAGPDGLITPALCTSISNTLVTTDSIANPTDGQLLGDDIRLWVERTACPEKAVCIRFLNRYDVPQTMMTPVPLDVKPGFQDQTAMMYGQSVRYSVDQNDEYILRSGVIHSEREYASWQDLVTSRQAEVLMYGHWLPIIITKANYTQVTRSMGRNRVEISFRMADPRQGGV